MVGGNDIGPRGEFQLLFTSCMLLMGAIINSILFGNMAVILQSFNRKATTFQEKLESASDTMKNLSMPEAMREEVEYYLSYTQRTLDDQNELDSFLTQLCPSLKQKVTTYVFQESIMKNNVFKNQHEVIEYLLQDLETKIFIPEDQIIRINQVGDSMFFMARGECEVFVKDINKRDVLTNTLTKGAYFGEISLLKE